jgi:hypothetical protein
MELEGFFCSVNMGGGYNASRFCRVLSTRGYTPKIRGNMAKTRGINSKISGIISNISGINLLNTPYGTLI